MELSKAEFAAHVGVSKGRVSQYIKAGVIGRDALIGEGRSARIDVEKATAQIRARRHIGQSSTGNGAKTAQKRPKAGVKDEIGSVDLASLIQAERLEQERRRNRRDAREEAVRIGQLVERAEVVAEHEVAARKVRSILDTLPTRADDVLAAAKSNGIAGVRAVLKSLVVEIERQIVADLEEAAAEIEEGRRGEH